MKKFLLFAIFIFSFGITFAQHFPFPQHTQYHTHIKPNQYTQDQLDDQVRAFYDQWKAKYLINGCEDDQYYVFFDSGNTVTVSEAMGYGMMIVPLMAGYDPDAKTIFNGLYRYYKAHPSHIMPHLMAWKQITGCVDADGPDSATDGDIDIAFGLLLAHAQWGSQGSINYFHEAELIINDIMGTTAAEGDINQDYYSIKLGDWVRSGHFMRGTRTSDFITDHFRAFKCAVKDTSWSFVIDECYALVDSMQTNFSPETGLLPDFIDDVDSSPVPAPANYLEGDHDGEYYYNACRDPWRLASDYLISGDERAKNAVLKIAKWFYQSTGGSVNNIHAGYHLDGTNIYSWDDNAFTAPFTVGAMLDTANQQWLNKLYTKIRSYSINSGGYYDNSIKLMSMITLSGNYWVPPCDILNGTAELRDSKKNPFSIIQMPGSEKLTLIIDGEITNRVAEFSVYNLSGQVVLTKELISSPKQEIVINSLPEGVYLFALKNKKGNILGTKKFLK
jgi:hypothetical protein